MTTAREVALRIAADLRRQREAYQAKIAPPKVNGETKAADLVKVLALYVAAHQYTGKGTDVPVPVDLLREIGNRLVGGKKWSTEVNDARSAVATRKHAVWQRMADDIWSRHNLSVSAVAQHIAKAVGGNARTIRSVIRKR